MKVRYKKHLIAKMVSAKYKSKSTEKKEETTSEPKVCRAFELLFKEVAPIQELLEDDLEILEKKPRGRPRKYFPNAEVRDDKHTHKIPDVSIIKPIGPNQKLKMVEMFRFHYKVNGLPLNAALERIEKAFNIPHRQAYMILESEF